MAALSALGMLVSPTAPAQSFTAAVEPATVELGEVVTLTLSLEGANPLSVPTLSLPEGVHARGPSRTQSFQIIGGRQIASVEFRYTLSFEKPGEHEIGPASVRTDKGVLKAAAAKVFVRAKDSGRGRDVLVMATLAPARAYVGQPVVATFELAVAREIAGYDLEIPFLAELPGLRLMDPEGLGERWNEAAQKTGRGLPGHAVLEVSSPQVKVVASVSQREIEHIPYTVYTVRRVLVPQEPRRLELGRARATANVVVGQRRRRDPFFSDPFFDDPFFGGSIFSRREAVTRAVAVSSEPLSLEVLELPRTGRPDGFAGAVGSYELEASASPREVVFGGSPVLLTVVVRGEGNVETVGPPGLSTDRDFRAGVPEQEQSLRLEGTRLLGEKRFTLPLRPRRPEVTEIPELRLEVFDPKQEKYVTLRAGPIPVTVTKPEGPFEVGTLVPPRTTSVSERHPETPVRDIEDIECEFDPAESHAAWLHRPAGLVAFGALPLAAFAAASLIARRLRILSEDATLARKLSAAKNARARLETLSASGATLGGDEFASQLSRALQTYIADRTGRPAGELAASEAAHLLRQAGASDSCAHEAEAILKELEAARFGGAGGDREGWLARVGSWVESAERELRR